MTNLIVSLGHIGRREEFKRAVSGASVHDFFNLMCVAIVFPLELATGFLQKSAELMSRLFAQFGGIKFTSPLKMATKPTIEFLRNSVVKMPIANDISYIILLVISIVFLFVALYFIVQLMRSLFVKRVEIVLNNIVGKRGLLAITAGIIFTSIVQSSSITTSLMVPLAAAGILTVETIFPIVLGANIGTTVTAILASFATGNIAAITVAFVHFLFNFIGTVFIYTIKPLRKIPIFLAKTLGEIAFKRRRYAVIYVLALFFIIPGLLILVAKILR